MTAQHPSDVVVFVPAAGSGTRLGPGAPKALRELVGGPMLVHAVRRLGRAPSVGCIVVAAPGGDLEAVRAMLDGEIGSGLALVVEGGPTRLMSVANPLRAAPAPYPIVLVHDAARGRPISPPPSCSSVGAISNRRPRTNRRGRREISLGPPAVSAGGRTLSS